MARGRLLLIVGAALLVMASPVLWWLISPLFLDRQVNEAFPGASTVAVAASVAPSSAPASAAPSIVPVASASPAASAASPAASVAEPTPPPTPAPTPAPSPTPSGPVALKSGEFHAVQHPGTGTATVYELPDGSRTLRLENFATDNGPDLYLYLSAAPDSTDEATVLNNQYVSLGQLKGNEGNQNYELPADLDLGAYNSVTVWCQQFSVNFTTAPLQ